jgi:hypothetical protein
MGIKGDEGLISSAYRGNGDIGKLYHEGTKDTKMLKSALRAKKPSSCLVVPSW